MFKSSFLSEEYIVSSDGYVLNKKGTHPLKPSINHKGYQIVILSIDGKRKGIAVHTLVARAFCDGYKNGLTVNHKDGNKLNNKATNLEWMSNKENIKHGLYVLGRIENKLGKNNTNSKSILAINKDTDETYKFDSLIDGAKFIKPSASYKELRAVQNIICQVLKNKRKSYKNYFWKYL